MRDKLFIGNTYSNPDITASGYCDYCKTYCYGNCVDYADLMPIEMVKSKIDARVAREALEQAK